MYSKIVLLLFGISFLAMLAFGCVPIKPNWQDATVALTEATARVAAYEISLNNKEEAIVVQTYLKEVNPDLIDTPEQWHVFIESLNINNEWELGLQSCVDIIEGYFGNSVQLDDFSKRLIKAFITGVDSGISIALSE